MPAMFRNHMWEDHHGKFYAQFRPEALSFLSELMANTTDNDTILEPRRADDSNRKCRVERSLDASAVGIVDDEFRGDGRASRRLHDNLFSIGTGGDNVMIRTGIKHRRLIALSRSLSKPPAKCGGRTVSNHKLASAEFSPPAGQCSRQSR